ncbi:hypothetical protein T07_5248 [Trichinella nelsoni]|uniref:Uncharacterized protein n=1 Tax=Trichinella nelsoni TaxID=6336 RepID=A0A0V0SJT9_9BILA|nr:hypothetical protein T07_5248 [Trichinella nelsoni]
MNPNFTNHRVSFTLAKKYNYNCADKKTNMRKQTAHAGMSKKYTTHKYNTIDDVDDKLYAFPDASKAGKTDAVKLLTMTSNAFDEIDMQERNNARRSCIF